MTFMSKRDTTSVYGTAWFQALSWGSEQHLMVYSNTQHEPVPDVHSNTSHCFICFIRLRRARRYAVSLPPTFVNLHTFLAAADFILDIIQAVLGQVTSHHPLRSLAAFPLDRLLEVALQILRFEIPSPQIRHYPHHSCRCKFERGHTVTLIPAWYLYQPLSVERSRSWLPHVTWSKTCLGSYWTVVTALRVKSTVKLKKPFLTLLLQYTSKRKQPFGLLITKQK